MTQTMTKCERVRATFQHQETDRVPLYDMMLNDACIEYFTGSYPPVGSEGARLQTLAVNAMLDMTRGVGWDRANRVMSRITAS
jgi:hypothetical protein